MLSSLGQAGLEAKILSLALVLVWTICPWPVRKLFILASCVMCNNVPHKNDRSWHCKTFAV